MADAPVAPLAGLRVVETATLLAGPYCAMLLGELGAEVVKVEPPGGEPGRHFGGDGLDAAFFAAVNRGKRSVTLDLRAADGRERLGELLAGADVLVENFLPSFRRTTGIDDEWLASRNPALVHCTVSGFGAAGPYAEQPATDIVLQALSGAMLASGSEGDAPVKVGFQVGDMTAGLAATVGVLAALRERDAGATGVRRVTTSILEGLLALQGPMVALTSALGRQPPRLGSGNPFNAPVRCVRAADGDFVVSAFTDKFWRRLCAAIERPELLDDARFHTNGDRLANSGELAAELDASFGARPVADWLERLRAAGVPCAPVNAYPDVVAEPQVRALDLLRETRSGAGAALTTVGPPFSLDGARPSAASAETPELER